MSWRSTALILLLLLPVLRATADPVITVARFQAAARVDDDTLNREYDSLDESPVVTHANETLLAFRPSVSEGPGGCPITDIAQSEARIFGDVAPLQITVSSIVSKTWTTSHNELCDYASTNFDAEGRLHVRLDAGTDAAAGKQYDVNISGSVSSDEIYGWLDGLALSSPTNERASFSGGTFSRTYTLDMAGATPGQLEFVVVAAGRAGESGWDTPPIERETTYVGEDRFRLRVVLFDPDSTPPAENCENGFDDDFDGDIDRMDPDCAVPEICTNGFDDDFDGDVDLADADCDPTNRVGLVVRCMHEPVYPQNGEEVTIHAMAYTETSDPVVVDEIQIYKDDMVTPAMATTAADRLDLTFTADDGTFSYGCRAHRNAFSISETATSWQAGNPILRTVDTGNRENAYPPWVNGVPVMLNGPPRDKIDVIFFADDTEYPLGASDPAFQQDVYDLIYLGYFRIPWFIHFQSYFNFWIGFDGDANASAPSPTAFCTRDAPTGFESRYSWVDTAAIVHELPCRDNAGSPGIFTIEASSSVSPQVVAHETGHRPFGLGDEYCCDGGYLTSTSSVFSSKWEPPYPNIFKKEQHCQDDAPGRSYQAQDCRRMLVGNAQDTERWFLEPYYQNSFPANWWLDQTFDPNVLSYRDLMQQTGWHCTWGETKDASGNPTGQFQWLCRTQYKVGNSEHDRMSWYIGKCANGEC